MIKQSPEADKGSTTGYIGDWFPFRGGVPEKLAFELVVFVRIIVVIGCDIRRSCFLLQQFFQQALHVFRGSVFCCFRLLRILFRSDLRVRSGVLSDELTKELQNFFIRGGGMGLISSGAGLFGIVEGI